MVQPKSKNPFGEKKFRISYPAPEVLNQSLHLIRETLVGAQYIKRTSDLKAGQVGDYEVIYRVGDTFQAESTVNAKAWK